MGKISWTHIKKIWLQGVEELSIVADQYGITVPDISLMAKRENWGDRGSNFPVLSDEEFMSPILDDKQVVLAHKTDLGRLRLIAATILENCRHETEINNVLKSVERLAKIYNIIIPLERKVFGITSDPGDTPDGIIIRVKNGSNITVNTDG